MVPKSEKKIENILENIRHFWDLLGVTLGPFWYVFEPFHCHFCPPPSFFLPISGVFTVILRVFGGVSVVSIQKKMSK